ncbi:transcriptional adapter 3, partial [Tremellales sp. Uapishka_1]
MPPRPLHPLPPYSSYITSLISSTSQPPLPTLDLLQTIESELLQRKNAIISRTKEEEALDANEKAGKRLEAIEKERVRNMDKETLKRKLDSPGGRVKKERNSASPAPSNASSTSFRPQPHAQPVTYGGINKKKKVKRVVDSDDEATARDRSTTLASPPVLAPTPSHPTLTSGLKLKLSSQPSAKTRPDPSPTPSSSTAAVSAIAGDKLDWSLPSQPVRALVPPRPGVQKPLKPGPKKQSEVDEDFSKNKTPAQVAFPTFWSGVESYLRDVREDDLAMLAFKADAPEVYDIPSRGRHYTEIWDEEDGNPPGTTPRFPVPNLRQTLAGPSQGGPHIPHFVPATEMRDENLFDEHRGLGSLTERIVAAVVGSKEDKEGKEGIESMEAMGMGMGKEPAKVDVVDLEERMKKELRAVMLLGEHDEYDPSSREDDEITSSLRQCQRLLHSQMMINEARKARLSELAKTRIAYTEYQTALEGIEKSIESSWAKRVKKKKTEEGVGAVPENLKRLVRIRQKWISSVGKCMREREKGEVVGLPTESIYR